MDISGYTLQNCLIYCYHSKTLLKEDYSARLLGADMQCCAKTINETKQNDTK